MKKSEGMTQTVKGHQELTAKAMTGGQAVCHDVLVSLPGILMVVLALLTCVTRAQAQRNPTGFLSISGQFHSLSATSKGGGGGAEWFHPLSEKSAVDLGIAAFSFAESRWSYAKLGGYSKHGDKTVFYGELNLGPGRYRNENFVFQIYKIGITRALVDKRLYAELEEQHIQVDTTTDNTLKTGTIFYPKPSLSCRLNYHFSIAGNTHSRLLTGRFDATKSIHYFTGFAVGRTTAVRFNLPTDTNGAVPSQEFYGGLALPVGRYELGGILDTVGLPGGRKYVVSFTWRIPL